jgi:thymidylate kinase
MHIAIEGLDGVGKTSAAKALEKLTGFTLIEYPIRYLTDGETGREQLNRLIIQVEDNTERDFTAMFYGTGNMYLKYLIKGRNVITDRYLASTYFWNCTPNNVDFFDFLVRVANRPDFTVLLFANADVRKERILRRNPNDPDLKKKIFRDSQYDKLQEFLDRYQMIHCRIDNSQMSIEETAKAIKRAATKAGVL